MKKILKFSAVLIAVYIVSVLVCTAVFADAVKNEGAEREVGTFSLSDRSGINFTADITVCTAGKSDGEINITITSETENGDKFFYSTDCGRTFKEMKGKSIRLTGAKPRSYSLRIKKKNGKTETVTDIYTVNPAMRTGGNAVVIYAESVNETIYKDGTITVCIGNFESGGQYEVSTDGGAKWHVVSSKRLKIRGFGNGTYTVLARRKDDPSSTSSALRVAVPEPVTAKKGYIKVKSVRQLPELPTGCEVTSLTMLLNYNGFKADKVKLADKYLPKGEYRGADPRKVFVGDPKEFKAYGCFSDVIVQTAEDYLKKYDKKGKWKVVNISGCTPNTLYAAIDNGAPVIVWASINMDNVEKNSVSWTDTETGRTISWTGGEHCLLLTGYDKQKKIVYVNDPMKGKTSYSKKQFEKRFKQLGSNAVIMIPDEK